MKRQIIAELLRAGKPELADAIAHVAIAETDTKPLVELLVYERALFSYHQFAHWTSAGAQYYGDHLLFQRLYEAIAGEIDTFGEKVVGLGGTIDVVKQSHDAATMLEGWTGDLPAAALKAEEGLLAAIADAMKKEWSDGVQNFLQGVADLHESHVYLLRQRNA